MLIRRRAENKNGERQEENGVKSMGEVEIGRRSDSSRTIDTAFVFVPENSAYDQWITRLAIKRVQI